MILQALRQLAGTKGSSLENAFPPDARKGERYMTNQPIFPGIEGSSQFRSWDSRNNCQNDPRPPEAGLDRSHLQEVRSSLIRPRLIMVLRDWQSRRQETSPQKLRRTSRQSARIPTSDTLPTMLSWSESVGLVNLYFRPYLRGLNFDPIASNKRPDATAPKSPDPATTAAAPGSTSTVQVLEGRLSPRNLGATRALDGSTVQ